MHRLLKRLHEDWLPLLLVAAGTVYLQAHLVAFWWELVGATGVVLCGVLDAGAIWLWYRGRGWMLLALPLSALLLGGPLVQQLKPLAEAYDSAVEQAEHDAAEAATLCWEISELQAVRATYQANSLHRTGWLGPIQQVTAKIEAKTRRLRELGATCPDSAGAPELRATDGDAPSSALAAGPSAARTLPSPANGAAPPTTPPSAVPFALFLRSHAPALLIAGSLLAVELLRVLSLVWLAARAAESVAAPDRPDRLPESRPGAAVASCDPPSQLQGAPEISRPSPSQQPVATALARVSEPASDPAPKREISGAAPSLATESGTPLATEPPSQPVASFDLTRFNVRRLHDLVEAQIAATSAKAVALAAGISPPDLSSFRAWALNPEQATRKPSRAAVDRLAAFLMPEAKEAR